MTIKQLELRNYQNEMGVGILKLQIQHQEAGIEKVKMLEWKLE